MTPLPTKVSALTHRRRYWTVETTRTMNSPARKESIMSTRVGLLSLLIAIAANVTSPSSAATSELSPAPDHLRFLDREKLLCSNVLNGSIFMRTELVFGMSRSGGPDITEAEFQSFIDDQVTPRFPDGLTVLSGNGQFKDSRGTIVQEKSKLLILLYPFARATSSKVEEIRREYQGMFQQQSVLRIDEESCVSF
jgi:Protein of unknown function (DUF3574)